MVDIITAWQGMGKFLYGYGFGEILSSVPQNRLAEIIFDLAMKGDQSRTSLPDETILDHYAHRWKIEVIFKQQKMYMGLRSFMVRSLKAIDRLLVILPLAHFFFAVFFDTLLPVGDAIRRFRTVLCTF